MSGVQVPAPPPFNSPATSGQAQEALRNQGFFFFYCSVKVVLVYAMALGAVNRTTRLAERQKMMQTWADYLDGLRAGAKVISLRRSEKSDT